MCINNKIKRASVNYACSFLLILFYLRIFFVQFFAPILSVSAIEESINTSSVTPKGATPSPTGEGKRSFDVAQDESNSHAHAFNCHLERSRKVSRCHTHAKSNGGTGIIRRYFNIY